MKSFTLFSTCSHLVLTTLFIPFFFSFFVFIFLERSSSVVSCLTSLKFSSSLTFELSPSSSMHFPSRYRPESQYHSHFHSDPHSLLHFDLPPSPAPLSLLIHLPSSLSSSPVSPFLLVGAFKTLSLTAVFRHSCTRLSRQ